MYAFLIVIGAISTVFKKIQNTKLRKKKVWDKSLKNGLWSNGIE